jgi:hypothetical protein
MSIISLMPVILVNGTVNENMDLYLCSYVVVLLHVALFRFGWIRRAPGPGGGTCCAPGVRKSRPHWDKVLWLCFCFPSGSHDLLTSSALATITEHLCTLTHSQQLGPSRPNHFASFTPSNERNQYLPYQMPPSTVGPVLVTAEQFSKHVTMSFWPTCETPTS